jgi:hypothetical protein
LYQSWYYYSSFDWECVPCHVHISTWHINYHQLWQLNLSVGQILKMIVTCSKVFRSHSFPLTWFGFSCQEIFLQTYMGPIKFTIHWSQRQIYKTLSPCQGERSREKMKLFRLLSYDDTSITTHIWPSHTICPLLVGVWSYIHTFT